MTYQVTYTAHTPMAHFQRTVTFSTKAEAETFAAKRRELEAKTWKTAVRVETAA